MSSNDLLITPVEYLKGVGPDRASLLKKELNIYNYGDLLQHFPYRYIDRSKIYSISEISDLNTFIQLKGKFSRMEETGIGRAQRLTAIFSDDSGSVEIVWFNAIQWVKQYIKPGETYVLFGKPGVFNSKINFTHPEIELFSNFESNPLLQGFQPLYNTSEKMKKRGLDSKGMAKIIHQLIKTLKVSDIPEILPEYLLSQYRLPSRYYAYCNIHLPTNPDDQTHAERRLKFEELFVQQLRMIKLQLSRKRESGHVFERIGPLFNELYEKHLPFSLTNAQKKVLKEIRKDTLSGHQMNRLLQGDVGSGKTIVSVLTSLFAIDNGFQAAIMAPTEILAQQHFEGVSTLLKPLPIKVAILTGSVKGKARKEILAQLESGEINLLIGTHALIEDHVSFKNLGMVVIDEQHRFGVEQRSKLWRKSETPPHVLVMTATPIPRSLALVFYGDLDHSILDELPPGRKPIQTIHRTEASRLRVFGFMKEQIALGRQIYIVYPLIQESEKLDLLSLMEGYESICSAFPMPQYQVSIVHGKLKPAVKEFEMQRFVKGETHIMVATTVIEVGVNVPNASVMIIENAERFGLSQLHQLRGRVGRGADQSFCILMTSDKLSRESRIRIKTMCDTNDGFKIAEADLELRGPGDVEGTRQSGDIFLKIANITTDKAILEEARAAASRILDTDPALHQEGHQSLSRYLKSLSSNNSFWSKIL